jgi:hypothetical protein
MVAVAWVDEVGTDAWGPGHEGSDSWGRDRSGSWDGEFEWEQSCSRAGAYDGAGRAGPGPGGRRGDGGARQVRRPSVLPGTGAAAGLAAYRRRRKFFWRRLLLVSVIAALGASAWTATERLFLAAGAQPAGAQPAGLIDCTAPTVPQQTVPQQTVALAAVEASPIPAANRLRRLDLAGDDSGRCSQYYVARPGDTIWGIAVRFAGNGDPRPLASSLESEIGGGTLQPGQVLAVP